MLSFLIIVEPNFITRKDKNYEKTVDMVADVHILHDSWRTKH